LKRRRVRPTVSLFAFQDIITSVVGIFVLITLIMVLELAQTVADAGTATMESVSKALLDSLAMMEQEVDQLQAEYDQLSEAQGKMAGNNRFNREQRLAEAQQQIEQMQQAIERTIELTEETQQSLIEAKKIEEQLLAEGQAVESEQQQILDLQDKQQEVQRYSSIMATEKPIVFRDQTDHGRAVVLVRLEDSHILINDSASRDSRDFSGTSRTKDFQTWLSSVDLTKRQILLIVKSSSVADFEPVKESLSSERAVWGFDVSANDQNFRLHYEMEISP
jgi:seryl-tRNA synthetase